MIWTRKINHKKILDLKSNDGAGMYKAQNGSPRGSRKLGNIDLYITIHQKINTHKDTQHIYLDIKLL